MIQKLRGNKKGFTLIELMIVIAIIGILAAIAVPQFLAYRMRSYNTAAKSVVHNLKADEANLNSELGVYGHTEDAAAALNAVAGAQGVADSHTKVGLVVAATPIQAGARIFGTTNDGLRSFAVGVTLGTQMSAFVDDANDASDNSTFHAFTRHFKGDTAYAIDMDVENVLMSVSNATAWPNVAGIGAATINAVWPPADDIVNKGGGGLPTVNWTRVR
jgi:type IV pilus assembly protein PilA